MKTIPSRYPLLDESFAARRARQTKRKEYARHQRRTLFAAIALMALLLLAVVAALAATASARRASGECRADSYLKQVSAWTREEITASEVGR